MDHRVSLEPAFVLHRRPFSNSSLIIEFFSKRYGRVAALARSARGLKSRYRGQLEIFLPMRVSWSGQRELKSLGAVEFVAPPVALHGKPLLCGFYLNELLMRLLHRDDPHARLFDIYSDTLEQLSCGQSIEIVLRCFEKKLLHELGYGLSLTRQMQVDEPILADDFYRYIPERGFVRCWENALEHDIFPGSSLLALHNEQFDTQVVLADAKRLMRLVLSYYLGGKPLKSRELLR